MRRFAVALLVVCLLSLAHCEYTQTASLTVDCSESTCDNCKKIKTTTYADTSANAAKVVYTCADCTKGSAKEVTVETKDGKTTGTAPTRGNDICFGHLMSAISAAFIAMIAFFMN